MAVSPKTRNLVAKRANRCCEYCRSQEAFSPDRFQIDHIIPQSREGSDEDSNLAWACGGCNNAKSDLVFAMEPDSQNPVSLFNPRVDHWNAHFRWSNDFLKIEGISAVGKATVDCLRLNRPNLVRLREVLKVAGAHPPALGDC